MDETPSQIEDRIRMNRENLKANFAELEDKVKTATDWRHYFREHTGPILAGAFASGMVLSAVMRKSPRMSVERQDNGSRESIPDYKKASAVRHQMHSAFDEVKGALLGMATSKVKSVLSEAVPGFAEHAKKAAESPATIPLGSSS